MLLASKVDRVDTEQVSVYPAWGWEREIAHTSSFVLEEVSQRFLPLQHTFCD